MLKSRASEISHDKPNCRVNVSATEHHAFGKANNDVNLRVLLTLTHRFTTVAVLYLPVIASPETAHAGGVAVNPGATKVQ